MITGGNSQTFSLPAGMALDLTVASGTTGRVTRLAQAPGGGEAQSVTAIAGANLSFGPYPEVERFQVDVIFGTVSSVKSRPSMATDAEVAAAIDALDLPNTYAPIDVLVDAELTGTTTVEKIILPESAPVNAVAASVEILATEIAAMGNGDTISFQETTFAKAGSTDATEGEFADAAGLAACVNELLGDDWTAVEDTDVTITSDTKGETGFNGLDAVASVLEATTAGGDAETEATATIAAAAIAVIANGDTVEFDDNTFTKVAADAGAGEFEDASGLIALIDALTDWGAADNAGAIDITAAAAGAEWNDIDVVITLTRSTAGGVDGTVAAARTTYIDDTYLYVAKADNTTADTNWRRVALGSAY